jgi:hypothetical protein
MTNLEAPETEPCRCPAQTARLPEKQHDPTVCLLLPSNHVVTVEARPNSPIGNWIATCSCGHKSNMAGPNTLEAARVSANEHAAAPDVFGHAGQLRYRLERELAEEELAYIATRTEACQFLADRAGWTEIPDPDDVERIRYAYADALRDVEAATGYTREHLNLALSIAVREIHPPAADPAPRSDVILVEFPVVWKGEGDGPVPEEIIEEISSRLPRWLGMLDDSYPDAWALGRPRLAGSEPLMVDLTRPTRWHEPGSVNGREHGAWEQEATCRVEFGDHFEAGWYVADHRLEVPAYRGPYETAQQALVGYELSPGCTVSWLGAHPVPEDPETR